MACTKRIIQPYLPLEQYTMSFIQYIIRLSVFVFLNSLVFDSLFFFLFLSINCIFFRVPLWLITDSPLLMKIISFISLPTSMLVDVSTPIHTLDFCLC